MTFAGEIYGTIRESGSPVKGASVAVECGNIPYPTQTDNYGSYRVFVPVNGKCSLTVTYREVTSRGFSVFSYTDPVRYEFEWNRGQLRRR
jgi:hypothetical protein